MDTLILTILVALIGIFAGACSGAVAALVAAWAARRKNNADAAESLTAAATSLIAPLAKRVTDLEDELTPLRPLPNYVERLLAGINLLVKQIRRLGVEPVWVPESETIPLPKNGRSRRNP